MKKITTGILTIFCIFNCLFFSGCFLGENNDAVNRKNQPTNPLVQKGEEQLTQKVYANEGEEVVLNLTDDAEYQFLMDRLNSASKQTPIPDWLVNKIETGRTQPSTRGIVSELPDGFGHAIVKLVIDGDNTVFATSYASILKGSEYIFLDIYVADSNQNPVTEYLALETHNGTSLTCHAKGSLYNNGSAPGSFTSVKADSLLCFLTKDSNGDGIDDLKDAALYISYCSMEKDIKNALYPSILRLDHPTIDNAPLQDAICKVCLDFSSTDCDYSPSQIAQYNSGRLVLPFKGEIIYPDMEIMTGSDGRPSPVFVDHNKQSLRRVNMVLALEDVGGITKKIKKEDTDFFWNHPSTKVSYNADTNVSTLSWDLQVDFGMRLFRASTIPRLFVIIDVPVSAPDQTIHCATTHIIPKGFYTDTPFEYKTFLTKADLAPGAHKLEVESVDWSTGAAIPGQITTYDWDIDSEAPQAELINTPSALTSCQKAAITVGGADVAQYSYKLDAVIDGSVITGSWSPARDIKYPILCDATKVSGTFKELEYKLAVCGIDRAGNKQLTPVACSWKIQPDWAPEARLNNLPVYFTNSQTATIEVTGTGIAFYQYQLDDEPLVEGIAISTLITLIDLQEGLHTLLVWGANGEQMQSMPTSYTWRVDLTSPTVELHRPISGDLITHANDIEVEVTGDDLFAYEYSLDNGPAVTQTWEKPILVTGLSSGNHWIKVYGLDRAGNKQAEPVAYLWFIDPAAADISFKKLPNKKTNNTNIMIQLRSKAGMRYRYKLDNATEWSKELPLENLLETPPMEFIQ